MPRLPHAREVTANVLDHVYADADWLDHDAPVAASVRAAALVLESAQYLRTEDRAHGRSVAALLDRLRVPVDDDRSRELGAVLDGLRRHVQELTAQPSWPAPAWDDLPLSAAAQAVPTMLTDTTRRFYKWLGSRLPAGARIAELGSWLGSSTLCLCEGLDERAGDTARVEVYDSFVWAAWMDSFVPVPSGGAWPRPGDVFLDRFHANLQAYGARVTAQRCWIDDGTTPGERPVWRHPEPIDVLVYDMGPDRAVLDVLWEVFEPHFLPGRTVLVFNEYGKVHATSLWEFCDDHGEHLVPEHKPVGTAKAFRYV
jgi:hypothetical protein